jgi:hypothetical protein
MEDKEETKFDMALSLSTGAVVRVAETSRGIALHFINPLIDPTDKRPTVNSWDDDRGRHTALPMSEEAAEALTFALIERLKQKEVSNV